MDLTTKKKGNFYQGRKKKVHGTPINTTQIIISIYSNWKWSTCNVEETTHLVGTK